MRSRAHERFRDGAARPAAVTPQRFLGALDGIERAKLPDDDLIRTLVERPAADLAFRHVRIVRGARSLVVSRWFRRGALFG
jgi:hypothetical protein